jgi:hypothetical protein
MIQVAIKSPLQYQRPKTVPPTVKWVLALLAFLILLAALLLSAVQQARDSSRSALKQRDTADIARADASQ